MKILFTLDALINAGTERSVLDLSRHFSEDVEVQLAYFYPRHDLRADYEAAGIQVHFLDLKGKYDFPQGISRLKKLVKQEKPDLLVSSLLRANLMSRMVSKQTGVPLLGTFVNDTYGVFRQAEHKGKAWWKYRFFWKLDQWSAGIPVHYIANAQSIGESNGKALGIPKERISVVYRGREVEAFKPWQAPRREEGLHFVAIGRLLERKGFRELIKAFKRVKKFHPKAQLSIYGEGPFRSALEALIQSLRLEDAVHLPGNVPNAWEKLYEAHCFVFPSWYEGFSGALVEAMMVGLPIVASGIPMNLEAVNRNMAKLHQPKNAEDLAVQMLWVMEHYEEAMRMGETAQAEAFARFDIRVIAKQYEEVLRKVVDSIAGSK